MLQMNEEQWVIARNLASDMVNQGTDPNEFGKVVAFMRQYRGKANAKSLLTLMLQRLVNSPNAPIRSDQTPEYYRRIQEACETHLGNIGDTDELMLVLGWCMRLMRYYNTERKSTHGERRSQKPKRTPQQPPTRTLQPQTLQPQTPQPQPPKEPEKPKIKRGTRVNATVLKKEAIKVTVRLHTDEGEEVIFERPYFPGKVGDLVKLKVQKIDGEGKVKEVSP